MRVELGELRGEGRGKCVRRICRCPARLALNQKPLEGRHVYIPPGAFKRVTAV